MRVTSWVHEGYGCPAKLLKQDTSNPKKISPRLAVVFAHYVEAMCLVENEDVVGAAPTGNKAFEIYNLYFKYPYYGYGMCMKENSETHDDYACPYMCRTNFV